MKTKKKDESRNNKISAVLVVYNEEKLIKRCLDSIKNVVDEIIIIHDGPCTDNTIKIAKKYTNKIFFRPHIGEAEPHRPFSFKKASGNWILQIDADEFLSHELKRKIRKLIKDREVDGYALKWDFYNHYGTPKYEYKMALFKKEKMKKFEGIPHEPVRINGVAKKSELILEHKPLRSPFTFKGFESKLKRANIHAKYSKKDKPAVFYLLKSIIWFFGYFVYYMLKFFNLRLAFFSAIYNFSLNWQIFILKIKNEPKAKIGK
ncbi:MAG: glycosyltransferase family 2 protein [Nanoarchaeota archaeon]|nr:glycosyltransferase family 2 protein [Nanoarchaeota archaeon]